MIGRIFRGAKARVGTVALAVSARVRGWRTARRALRELELGRNPDGSTVVLDYRSGRVIARRPKATLPCEAPLVPFEYADLAWLERVIGLSGYAVQLDDEGDLEVRTEAGPVYVRRGEATTSLRFFVRVIGETDWMGSERAATLNLLNMHAVHGRWVLNEELALFMSCDLHIGVGISSAQVLSALRACTHEVCVATAMLGLDRNVA